MNPELCYHNHYSTDRGITSCSRSRSKRKKSNEEILKDKKENLEQLIKSGHLVPEEYSTVYYELLKVKKHLLFISIGKQVISIGKQEYKLIKDKEELLKLKKELKELDSKPESVLNMVR